MKVFLIFILTVFSVNAISIDCIFKISNWGNLGDIYTCEIKSSQIVGNESYITGFTGTHTAGSLNSNVKGIVYKYNCHHIEEVPTNLHKFFPNFIAFSMWNCGVSKFSGNELNLYRNLEAFHFTEGSLESIPGNLFAFNPRVKSVRFIDNKIKHVGANLFDIIQNNLGKLDFAGNICVNQNANTPATISTLINYIRIYCADVMTSNDLTLENISSDLKIENKKLLN